MIDRIPWDEADLKVKRLIYLSLGSEGTRTYHHRNPHTRIERCTTNGLVHELAITFTRPGNTTFDQFHVSKPCKDRTNPSKPFIADSAN